MARMARGRCCGPAEAGGTFAAGPDPDDPTAAHDPVPDYLAGIAKGVRGLRIGVDRSLIAAGTDADMVRATEEGATVLTRIGALVRDVTFPSTDVVVRDTRALCSVEAAIAHEATYPSRASEYGPVLAGLLDTGRSLDGLEVTKILLRRQAFRGQLNSLLRDIDLLIMPAMHRAAPSLADVAPVIEASRRFVAPFNMSGHPTLTLPGGETGDGLPVGFQIVGRHMEEALVLRAGHAFQQETDWHRRRPPRRLELAPATGRPGTDMLALPCPPSSINVVGRAQSDRVIRLV